jgi:aspartyl-tRNA synthetase
MEYKMAEHIPLGNLSGYTGQDVSVCGWVESVRRLGGMNFIVLRDRSGKVQVTFEKEEGSPLEERISALVPNSTVYVTGIVNADPRVKLGGIEIRPSAIDVTSVPTGALPINDRSKEDERLDWRFLALREPKNELIFRVQTTAEHAMRAYWIEHGFIEIHSPKLVAGATESGSELFQLDYFGQRASLAQSPQFYKQMAMAAGLERVFEIGPVFRANPSHTVRHDTEFTGVDMEM